MQRMMRPAKGKNDKLDKQVENNELSKRQRRMNRVKDTEE